MRILIYLVLVLILLSLGSALVYLVRDRGEAIALDGESQDGDFRPAHSAMPFRSAIRCVAFSPVPVSTITVSSSGPIAPLSSSFLWAAAVVAQVGST